MKNNRLYQSGSDMENNFNKALFFKEFLLNACVYLFLRALTNGLARKIENIGEKSAIVVDSFVFRVYLRQQPLHRRIRHSNAYENCINTCFTRHFYLSHEQLRSHIMAFFGIVMIIFLAEQSVEEITLYTIGNKKIEESYMYCILFKVIKYFIRFIAITIFVGILRTLGKHILDDISILSEEPIKRTKRATWTKIKEMKNRVYRDALAFIRFILILSTPMLILILLMIPGVMLVSMIESRSAAYTKFKASAEEVPLTEAEEQTMKFIRTIMRKLIIKVAVVIIAEKLGNNIQFTRTIIGIGFAIWRYLESPIFSSTYVNAGLEILSGMASTIPRVGRPCSITIDIVLVGFDIIDGMYEFNNSHLTTKMEK